ncbi:MAG: hypothetical protein Q9M19_07185 [Mariprofundaceae bacterium]|nr:hypothetical protein [Mariprofundaceae bacterium]
MSMKQQQLPLCLPQEKNADSLLSSWVSHAQVEVAFGRLALWLVQGGLLWLTSTDVAGKSHLLRKLSVSHPQIAYIDASLHLQTSSVRQLKVWLETAEHHAFWILDLPAGKLSPNVAYAAFHLIERAKTLNRALLISWRDENLAETLPELSSRLLMMEALKMAEPDKDEDLQQILQSVLKGMQWEMKESVIKALLLHVPRRLSDLLEAVLKLDQYSRQYAVKINGALAVKVLLGEQHD